MKTIVFLSFFMSLSAVALEPELALRETQREAENFVLAKIHEYLPGAEIASLDLKLSRGKFKRGIFSDYMTGVTMVANHPQTFKSAELRCEGSIYVYRDMVRLRSRDEVVLYKISNEEEIVATLLLSCDEIRL